MAIYLALRIIHRNRL